MKLLKHVVAALLLVALFLVVVQNLSLIDLHFAAWTIALPVAAPVAIAYLLGGLTAERLLRFFIREKRTIQRERRVRREIDDRLRRADRPVL